MITELVSVGTEILLGNIVNTNSAYLAEKCAELGLAVYYQTVTGDNEKRLMETVETAVGRSDIVILTGGLGPTEDDLTKETVARVLNLTLEEDEQVRKHIEEYLKAFQKSHPGSEITSNNWKQAYVPCGAVVVENKNGTAPGLIIEKDTKTVILLPGPPGEMKPMFEESIYPYLQQRQNSVIYSRMIKICGIGESQAETLLKDLLHKQENPTIATYAKTGEVHVRITAKAQNEKEARKLIKPVVRELKARFGTSIYTTDKDKTLEEAVVELLREEKLVLSLAESCTGGMVASRIVNAPGASDVFGFGYVTYSNKAKRKNLRVKKNTLKEEGAVSAKCAKEMAKGACFASGSEVSVSVTGTAGPDGGTKEKPVGTVFMGCCLRGKTTVREYHFKGSRESIREQAATYALILLRECILESAEE